MTRQRYLHLMRRVAPRLHAARPGTLRHRILVCGVALAASRPQVQP